MRFNITFTRTGKHRMLPFDYQYYLSAWIYKVIGKADSEFSHFLHSEGFQNNDYRKFKLFNYSPLYIGKPVIWKEKSLYEVRNEQVNLKVSFNVNESAEKFIMGLFTDQKAYIGDQFNGLELTVSQIERLPYAPISHTLNYKAVSPIVISQKKETDRYAQYLGPEDNGYADLFIKHLLAKHSTVPHVATLPEEYMCTFNCTNEPRYRTKTIKPYTKQQSKVKGYLYDFELTAPEPLHRLILASGAGEKNSVGFGWCEVKG